MIGWVAVALVSAVFVAVMVGLWRSTIRPVTEQDQRLSRVDVELDEVPRPSSRGWSPRA